MISLEPSQDDILRQVFQPFMGNGLIPSSYLIDCILAFMNTLQIHDQPLDRRIETLLVTLYLDSQLHSDLYQLIQMEIIRPSVIIAKLCLSHTKAFQPFLEMGIEMLDRLDSREDVTACMLVHNMVIRVIEYALRHDRLQSLSPVTLLDKAYNTGNNTLFLNVYRVLEDHCLIPHPALIDMGMVSSDGRTHNQARLKRFVSVFRELWGPQIEMQGLVNVE